MQIYTSAQTGLGHRPKVLLAADADHSDVAIIKNSHPNAGVIIVGKDDYYNYVVGLTRSRRIDAFVVDPQIKFKNKGLDKKTGQDLVEALAEEQGCDSDIVLILSHNRDLISAYNSQRGFEHSYLCERINGRTYIPEQFFRQIRKLLNCR